MMLLAKLLILQKNIQNESEKTMKVTFFIIALITLCASVYAMLELVENRLIFYLLTCLIVPLGFIGLVLKSKLGKVFMALSLGMILSWATYYPIYRIQAKAVSENIKAIPKEKLEKFIETGDINYIPKGNRAMQIGLKTYQIRKINYRKTLKIKAAGWKTKLLFGYYDFTNEYYATSVE